MSKKNDGGPAFPMPANYTGEDGPANYDHEPEHGMSLRDWFAGQAMAGLLHKGGYNRWDYLAEDAFNIADEMLKAR